MYIATMNKSKTNPPRRCLPVTTHITTVHCCCMNAQYRSSSYMLSMLCLCLVQLSKSQRSNADSWPDWQLHLWLVSSWLITGALIALTVHHMTLITSQGQGAHFRKLLESWGTDATTESAPSVALLWYFAWSLWSLLTDSEQLWCQCELMMALVSGSPWEPYIHYTTAIVRHFLQNKAHVKSWDWLQKFVHVFNYYSRRHAHRRCHRIHVQAFTLYWMQYIPSNTSK